MAQRIGAFVKVADVLARFVKFGCEVRVAENTVVLNGEECANVRYVFNPANGKAVPLQDAADDESISKDEAEFLERRLGLVPRRRDRP